jgi:hypothetical protein
VIRKRQKPDVASSPKKISSGEPMKRILSQAAGKAEMSKIG